MGPWLGLLLCTVCFASWEQVFIPGLFEDYGCEYTARRSGYLIQTNLSACQETCRNGGYLTEGNSSGCKAIEWHRTTGWCNFYVELCNASVDPAQAPKALWNGRQNSYWYRSYNSPDSYYSVTCVLPHSETGAVRCASVTKQCDSVPTPGAPTSDNYKLANSSLSGLVISCEKGQSDIFSNSALNPCDVLNCALTSKSLLGYVAYRYIPTLSPTTPAPTRLPTTSSPTTDGATLSPTTLFPTLYPTTLGPTTVAPTRSPTSGFCALDLTGSLFKLKNCSDNRVLRGSCCQLICEAQSSRTDLFVNCSSEGKISWPPACVLEEISIAAGSPIALKFGLDFTLGCKVDTSDSTDVALVDEALANNIAQQLGILPNGSSVDLTATTAADGFLDFILVLRDRPPNTTASEDANLVLGLLANADQRNNLFLLSFIRNGIECQVQGSLVRFWIDFESLVRLLFDWLANLPDYGLALLLLALVAVLVLIPWSSRKSPHPFALLLLLTSMFSFANRVYFLAFLGDLSSRAALRDPSLAPLKDIYVATAVFLALSVVLNVVLSTVLFIGLRSSSKFQRRWFELHRGSAACGLLASAFNPGNILILRSRMCNSESLNAPFPLEHLRRLEWIGVVCALVGDLPPLVLTGLAMGVVQGSSLFNWSHSKLNLLLPIVFSSAVIAAAFATRACRICRYSASLRQDQPSSTTSSAMDLGSMD